MLKKTIAVTAMTGALVAGVLVTPGLAAGKGGGPKNTTTATDAAIAINQADPRLGDLVTFSTSVPGGVSSPLIEVNCYQDTARVYGAVAYPDSTFTLGGYDSVWVRQGGGALCTAALVEWTNVKTAHMTRTEYASTVFAAGDRIS